MITENPTLRKTLFYFSLVMVLLYVILGLSIAFTNFMIEIIPTNRTIIGVVLAIYGLFRLYVLYRQNKTYKIYKVDGKKNEGN